MSSEDGSCEYVLDPDRPETWDGEEGDECYVHEDNLNEDGVWTCPHDAEEKENLCIFHLPIEDKDEKEIVNSFFDVLEQATASDDAVVQKRKLQFIGARFGTFDLNGTSPEIREHGLDFSYAEFDGIFNWSNLTFEMTYLLFSGVTFQDDVDFEGTDFGGEVSFLDTEFRGEASFLDSEFEQEVTFSNAEFGKEVNFSGTKFVEEVSFSDAEFGEEVDFLYAEFEGKASFTKTRFVKNINFLESYFGEHVNFTGAEFREGVGLSIVDFGKEASFYAGAFGGEVSFARTEFGGEANFLDTEFEGETSFTETGFGEDVTFGSAKFRGDVGFMDAEFGGDAKFEAIEFWGEVTFVRTEFGGDVRFNDAEFKQNISFVGAKFGGPAFFWGAEFGGDANFEAVEFDEAVKFRDLNLDMSRFVGADLTDAVFTGASLCNANFESALLSRASLLGADLRGAKFSGAVLGDVRIDEKTKFLGGPDGSATSPHTLSAIRSRPTCVYDPSYKEDNEHEDVDKAKSVYRALEELGGKHARPRLQARCFVRRQDLQRRGYWDDATADDASLEQRLIAGARWSRAKVARVVLLYGESPWRIIAWSLAIVLGFALLYPLGGWMEPEGGDPLTYTQIATNPIEFTNSVYYSTLTFTALGFGDFQPVGFGRALTTIETGLGAVLLALLVFILGRRAAR